jgi:glutamyl-tRNA reductase
VLTRRQIEPILKRRRGRSLLLIDIAVPRDIEPEVNFLEDVYLYNVDDLQAIASDYLDRRKAELERCEAIVEDKVQALVEGLRPQEAKGEGKSSKLRFNPEGP